MNSADSFGSDYQAARTKFRAAVAAAGGTCVSIPHPERGPDGSDLSTDVAWFGPNTAEKVLVTISATHGVEGFCGSGAQVDWLRRGEAQRLPAGVAALLVHAINPYGFAWHRRVTQENVDLNRNWINFRVPLPANPGYDALSEAICPSQWSEAAVAASTQVLQAYAKQHGAAALQHAVSAGQYKHPQGIFYGGSGPTWSRRTQTEILSTHLKDVAAAAIIDYHTGLGPWGYGEQIITRPPGTPEFARAAQWFGAAVTCPYDGTSLSAAIVGDGLSAASALLPRVALTGIALEVGTRPLQEVLLALRADAWLHAHGDPASPLGRALKAQMRQAFYGDADDWKGMVAGQSLLLCRQALAGLARWRAGGEPC